MVVVKYNWDDISIGMLHYKNHWISYGCTPGGWCAHCLSCGEEHSGSSEEFYELDEDQKSYFWLYQFGQFSECEEVYDDYTEVVMDKVRNKYFGKIATRPMRKNIQEEVNAAFVGSSGPEVTFKDVR